MTLVMTLAAGKWASTIDDLRSEQEVGFPVLDAAENLDVKAASHYS